MTNTEATGASSPDWSRTLLGPPEKWPWRWQLAMAPRPDPGPGRRSGEGTVTIRPYLDNALAAKAGPDEADRAR